jgi:hypothetical protein
MSAKAGSLQEKAASHEPNTCTDAGESCNGPEWTCIDQGNFVVEAGNSCADAQARGQRRSYFLERSRFRRRASRYLLRSRKMLLHFRHRIRGAPEIAPAFPASHPWRAGNCSCISGIPTIPGHKKSRIAAALEG